MSQEPPLRGEHRFTNRVVRMADLTVNTTTIEDLSFSNCRIIGPAILALLHDVTIDGAGWNTPSIDAIFWEVSPGRGAVVGVIGVANCSFSNCQFENIGIAGPPQLRAQLETAFS